MQISLGTDKNTTLTAPETLPVKKTDTPEADKKRLYKAAKELEAMFMYHMLKAMRKTVPETESAAMGGDMGKDIYTQIFDQELSQVMASANQRGLADSIYRSLVGNLENDGDETQDDMNTLETVLPRKVYLPVTDDSRVSVQSAGQSAESSPKQSDLETLVKRAAKKYDLDPQLLQSVIQTESGGDPKAVSSAGAKGLMQLVDTTAADMGVDDVFDPEENINGGAKYLRLLLNRFGDVEHALAAYNAGPSTVERYGGIPPYTETQNYVRRVLAGVSDHGAGT